MSKKRIIVNVADAKVSSDPRDILVIYSLGSCIGVCLYDPAIHIGGMLHYQLPDSKMDKAKAGRNPFMFADSGMEVLIEKLFSMGANKKRVQIKIAGAATMQIETQKFDIGKRNHLAIRRILWKEGMLLNAEDIGGTSPRHMYLNIANGTVIVKTNGFEKKL
ncbi:MAG: chemotaxis protein CheD [Planctomycetota bacterium]|jgi:chemotaxis protein CheD